jgi:dephospho-CoA kinase
MLLLIIGVTGGIGSGKSTVSRILYDLGAKVIDVDRIAREVTDREEVMKKLKEVFGAGIETGNGKLDRNKLADLVFGRPDELLKLNQITHEYISSEILVTIKRLKQNKDVEIVVIDAAIPFERGFIDITDKIWVVTADKEIRMKRIMERNGLSREEILKRMDSQIEDRDYLKIADKVLDNNGHIEELEKIVARLYVNLKAN